MYRIISFVTNRVFMSFRLLIFKKQTGRPFKPAISLSHLEKKIRGSRNKKSKSLCFGEFTREKEGLIEIIVSPISNTVLNKLSPK